MKPFLILCAVASLALTGCESVRSVPGNFREKFSPTYRTHVVAGTQRQVYEAARAALSKFGFRFLTGGPAQGKMEALNSVAVGGDAQSARQVSLNVKLSPAANGGGTEVAALFSEILEDKINKREGMGTTQPMKDSPLYDVFFRHIEEELAKAAAGK